MVTAFLGPQLRCASCVSQVIGRVPQTGESTSFDQGPIRPIVAERIARKYWPHRNKRYIAM